MSLREIVNIEITAETTTIPQAGFGTAMILAKLASGSPTTRVTKYTSQAVMYPDFATDSAVYRAAGKYFAQNPSPAAIYVGLQAASGESITASLNACLIENKNWYGLLLISRDADDVVEVADWAESNKRLFVTASSEDHIISQSSGSDTDSVAHALDGLYTHTACIYHENHKDSEGADDWGGVDACYADAALLGKILPMDPGSYTAKFKSLDTVPASNLNDTKIDHATSKHCNVYTSVATIPIFQHGQVTKPEWIDTIIGIDWLQARMTERIFGKLVNLPKIPFTDAGIGIIEAEIKAQLKEAVNKGFLTADPAPIVVVPKAKDISANDKNLRQLNGITFTGFLAGAIHYTEIHGVVKSEG